MLVRAFCPRARPKAESEAIAVGYLVKAMPHAPTAVISWLERRFGERWSRGERRELTGESGGSIRVEAKVETEGPAERLLRDLDRMHRRVLGNPEEWTQEQVEEMDAEVFIHQRALIAHRVGPE